jgi:hypothetical protein
MEKAREVQLEKEVPFEKNWAENLEDIQSDLVIWPSTRKFMLADWCFRT